MSRFLLPFLLIQGYLLRSPWFFMQELGLSLAPYITGFNIGIGIVLLISALFKSDKTLALVYVIAYSLSAYIFFNMLNYSYFDPAYMPVPYFSAHSTNSNTTLKIFYANIYYQNSHTATLLEQIQSYNPDIVMLVEYANLQDQAIGEALQEEYPYTSRLLGVKWYDGDVIFARTPLETIQHDNTSLLFSHVKTRHNSRDIDIMLAHTSAPISQRLFKLRNQQLDELHHTIHSYISDNHPSNMLVAWDFNITPFSSYYQWFEGSLASLGMRNITRDLASTQYDSTIPYTWCLQNLRIICAHIDHLRFNQQAKLERIPIVGSDHYGFVGTLRIF